MTQLMMMQGPPSCGAQKDSIIFTALWLALMFPFYLYGILMLIADEILTFKMILAVTLQLEGGENSQVWQF